MRRVAPSLSALTLLNLHTLRGGGGGGRRRRKGEEGGGGGGLMKLHHEAGSFQSYFLLQPVGGEISLWTVNFVAKYK